MKITVEAIRDADGAVVGETIFDIQDKDDRARAVTDLMASAAPSPIWF